MSKNLTIADFKRQEKEKTKGRMPFFTPDSLEPEESMMIGFFYSSISIKLHPLQNSIQFNQIKDLYQQIKEGFIGSLPPENVAKFQAMLDQMEDHCKGEFEFSQKKVIEKYSNDHVGEIFKLVVEEYEEKIRDNVLVQYLAPYYGKDPKAGSKIKELIKSIDKERPKITYNLAAPDQNPRTIVRNPNLKPVKEEFLGVEK